MPSALTSFKKFLQGIKIVPKTSTGSSSIGDLEVLSTDGKLYYRGNSGNSPVVTESQPATLTNKTLESAISDKKLLLSKNGIGGFGSNATIQVTKPYTLVTATGTSIAGIDSTAIGGVEDGQTILITNSSGSSFVILNDSTGAPIPSHRVLTGVGAPVTIPNTATAVLIYNVNAARWQLVSGNLTSTPNLPNVTTITTTTTLTNTNDYVLVNGTGVTVNLPTTLVAGKTFNIKKIFNDTVPVVIQCASAQIDGQVSTSITQRYDNLTITTDGTNYFIL